MLIRTFIFCSALAVAAVSPKQHHPLGFVGFPLTNDGANPALGVFPESARPVTGLPPARIDPIETALRLQAMLDSGAYRTRAELAAAVGLSPARISQVLNLLKLPADVQQRLRTDPALTYRRVGDAQPESGTSALDPSPC